MSEKCPHKKVTRFSREVFAQTWREPAEWEDRITCDECDEEFNEAPEGSELEESLWEDQWDFEL